MLLLTTEEQEEVVGSRSAIGRILRRMKKTHLVIIALLCLVVAIVALSVVVIILANKLSTNDGGSVPNQPNSTPTTTPSPNLSTSATPTTTPSPNLSTSATPTIAPSSQLSTSATPTIATASTTGTTASYSWQQDACNNNPTCSIPNWPTRVPVLMISLDGFRADYIQRGFTPAIQRLVDCGSHSPFMYSSYPSKTFPNHYSIVTGLHPESHGIIDNYMYDPVFNQTFNMGTPDPKWWGGEPLWTTAERNGLKSAIYFWPGSDKNISGSYPTYYKNYNGSVPFNERVNQTVQWLLLPANQRPAFLGLYFDQPDENGHQFGPDSNQVNDALLQVDSMINLLLQQLNNNQLMHCLNIIIVSDHGMQAQNHQVIAMNQYFDTTQTQIFEGPVGRVMINSNAVIDQSTIHEAFRCKNSSVFRSYTSGLDSPRRIHYTRNRRIGEVIVDSNAGYYVKG
uniref:Uncharacterized protein n=1 Tax=Plectus sambesii TaxID=2011161 RepID=A0A914UZA9_9BILA